MFRHTLVEGTGAGEATMAIFGDAVFTEAQEMERALGAALDACRRLTIDVGGVQNFDGTFRVLLCSLHRRSQLENKTIVMHGNLRKREQDRSWQSKLKGCPFDGIDRNCPLCQPTEQPAPTSSRQEKS